jgi:hypothetical protein
LMFRGSPIKGSKHGQKAPIGFRSPTCSFFG